MRVQIDHGEDTKGAIFKKKYNTVTLSITFTEEEKQAIKENDLEGTTLLKRPPSAELPQNSGQPDDFFLTLYRLVRRPDVYYLTSIGDAKAYEADVMDMLPQLKEMLNANTGIEEKSKTLEF